MALPITRMKTALACLTAVAMWLAGPANATLLEQIRGDVMVDDGNGFRPVQGAIVVNPGTRIMARTGASAMIKYSDKCIAEVTPGAIVSVAGEGGCASSPHVNTDGRVTDDVSFGRSVSGPENTIATGTGTAAVETASTTALAVAAVAVGAGGLIYLSTKKAAAPSP